MSDEEDEVFWGVQTEAEIRAKAKNCPRRTTLLNPWNNVNISPRADNELDEKTKFLEDSFGNLFFTDATTPDSSQNTDCVPEIVNESPVKFTSVKALTVSNEEAKSLDNSVRENSASVSTTSTPPNYKTARESPVSNTNFVLETPTKFTSLKTLTVNANDVELLGICDGSHRENSVIFSSTSTSPNYDTARESHTDFTDEENTNATKFVTSKTLTADFKDTSCLGKFDKTVIKNPVNFPSTSTSPNYDTARESQASSSDFSFMSKNITVRKCKTPLKEPNEEKISDFEENMCYNSSDCFRVSPSQFSTFTADSMQTEDEVNVVISSEFNSMSSMNEVDAANVMLSSDSCLYPEEDAVGDDDEAKENKGCQTSFWYIPLPKKSEQITQHMKTNVSNADRIATATTNTAVTSFKTPMFKTPQNPKKICEVKEFSSERKCKRALISPKPVMRKKTVTKYEVESPVGKYIRKQVPPLICNVRSKSIGQMLNTKRLPNTTPSKIPRLVHGVSTPTIYRHPKTEK